FVLRTNNVDHHRTADFPALASALSDKPDITATMRDVAKAPAILLVGNDPTERHPLLAWQIRNNVRLNRAKLYVVNSKEIKLRRQATSFLQVAAGGEAGFLIASDAATLQFRGKLATEKNLLIIFGSEFSGKEIASLVKFGSAIEGAKFLPLGDYANSRGAADMGLYPDLLPGYQPVSNSTTFHQEWGGVPQ